MDCLDGRCAEAVEIHLDRLIWRKALEREGDDIARLTNLGSKRHLWAIGGDCPGRGRLIAPVVLMSDNDEGSGDVVAGEGQVEAAKAPTLIGLNKPERFACIILLALEGDVDGRTWIKAGAGYSDGRPWTRTRWIQQDQGGVSGHELARRKRGWRCRQDQRRRRRGMGRRLVGCRRQDQSRARRGWPAARRARQ